LLLDVFTTWLGKLNEDVDAAMEPVEEEELLSVLDELRPAQPFSTRIVLPNRSSRKKERLMRGH
jgi:hypothetical protein